MKCSSFCDFSVLQVVPAIDHLTSNGAQFADGQVQEFDAIILATGYRSNVPQWLNVSCIYCFFLLVFSFFFFKAYMQCVNSTIFSHFAETIEGLKTKPATDSCSCSILVVQSGRIIATFSPRKGSQGIHHREHGKGKLGCTLLVWGGKEFWELPLMPKILQTTSVNSSLQLSLNPMPEFSLSLSSSSSS